MEEPNVWADGLLPLCWPLSIVLDQWPAKLLQSEQSVLSFPAHMQNAQLANEVTVKERDAEQLQTELQGMRIELEAQVALHSEFEVKLAQHAQASQQEIQSLRKKLAGMTQTRATAHSMAEAHGESDEVMEELEVQLAEAERGIESLTAEKVQLLEAYELLEEDIGRLIDEAVAKQQSRTAELNLQVEVRFTGPTGRCPPHCSEERRPYLYHSSLYCQCCVSEYCFCRSRTGS
jgi:DNA repair exonuclease SbcCD ATPase subunit